MIKYLNASLENQDQFLEMVNEALNKTIRVCFLEKEVKDAVESVAKELTKDKYPGLEGDYFDQYQSYKGDIHIFQEKDFGGSIILVGLSSKKEHMTCNYMITSVYVIDGTLDDIVYTLNLFDSVRGMEDSIHDFLFALAVASPKPMIKDCLERAVDCLDQYNCTTEALDCCGVVASEENERLIAQLCLGDDYKFTSIFSLNIYYNNYNMVIFDIECDDVERYWHAPKMVHYDIPTMPIEKFIKMIEICLECDEMGVGELIFEPLEAGDSIYDVEPFLLTVFSEFVNLTLKEV